jgi:uncharacterized protein with HEPN domain
VEVAPGRTLVDLAGLRLDLGELLDLYLESADGDAFASDIEKQDSVIRRLEIIGDAVKGIPQALSQRHRPIPWPDIAGARDILIHE